MPQGDSSATPLSKNPVGVDTAIKAGAFADSDVKDATAKLSSFVQWRNALRALSVRDPESLAIQIVLHG